ncbi:MAG: MaoC family dehydratase [Verrucomicrobiota bacterium]|nr:MaoC family dehydratase [Verrucomicrobiota bacterium]
MGRAFEDFPVGSRFVSTSQTISQDAIVEFARRYDPQPFHLESNPNDNLLGGLAASGWQTAAISMRLFVDTMQVEGGIIGRALDELRWPLAVHPGDSLRVEVEILEARLSLSKPGYGLLRYRSLTLNQDDKVVQGFIALAILPARTAPPGVGAAGGQ